MIQKRSDKEKHCFLCNLCFWQLLHLSSEMSPSFVLPHLFLCYGLVTRATASQMIQTATNNFRIPFYLTIIFYKKTLIHNCFSIRVPQKKGSKQWPALIQTVVVCNQLKSSEQTIQLASSHVLPFWIWWHSQIPHFPFLFLRDTEVEPVTLTNHQKKKKTQSHSVFFLCHHWSVYVTSFLKYLIYNWFIINKHLRL